jgi:hypothetical protein
MKRTRTDIDRLMGELALDCAQLAEQRSSNERALARIEAGSQDSLDYAALGYTIHNIYGLIENACLRIAKFFENGLPREAWHRELLDRMLVDIQNVRPRFFTRDAYLLIDDLRAFRHVFRNLYNRDLDADKLLLIQKKVPRAISAFVSSVENYERFLTTLKQGLDE